MHDSLENSTRRKRLPVARVAVGVLVAMWTLGVLLRSDLVLRPLVERELEALENEHGLRLEVGRIGPRGFASVRLADIRVHGESGDLLVHVDSLDVRPSAESLLRIRPVLERIDVEGVYVDVSALAEHRASTAELSSGDRGVGGSGASAQSSIRAADVYVSNAELYFDALGVERTAFVHNLEVHHGGDTWRLEGRVHADGVGRANVLGSWGEEQSPQFSVRMLEDHDFFELLPQEWSPSPEAELSLGSIDVDWPPAVTVRPVLMRQMNLPLPGVETWRLDDVWADRWMAEWTGDGFEISARNPRINFSGLLSTAVFQGREVSARWDAIENEWTFEGELTDGRGGRVFVNGGASAEIAWLGARADVFDASEVVPVLPTTTIGWPTRAIIDGTLDVVWRQAEEDIGVAVDVTVRELAMESAPLSHLPLDDVRGRLTLFGGWEIGSDVLRLDGARYQSGGVDMSAHGVLERHGRNWLVELRAMQPDVEAQEFIESMPWAMRYAIDGLELDGPIDFGMVFRADTAVPDRSHVTLEGDLSRVSVVRFPSQLPVPRMLSEEGVFELPNFGGGTRLVGPGTDAWVSLSHVPEHTWRSILAAEDDAFWMHDGFDWRGINRALQANVVARGFVRGGSTISQQVVKNLFLSHDRTLARKLQEALITVLVERHVPKRRILEYYINLAHWGPEVYGIRDAARQYFARSPHRLSLRESAFLASILPDPRYFGEEYARGNIVPSRRVKMQNIVHNLERSGFLEADEAAQTRSLLASGNVSPMRRPVQLIQTEVHQAEAADETELSMNGTLLLLP